MIAPRESPTSLEHDRFILAAGSWCAAMTGKAARRLHSERLDGGETVLRLHDCAVHADPSGALYWPDENLLVVADLHLEKGSSYAARRVFLPPYDTSATLARLGEVLDRYQPKRVVALGDSFHDKAASERLLPRDVAALAAMQRGREWVWIAGNHDPLPPWQLEGDHLHCLAVGHMCFRHHPSQSPCDGEVAGHLHPVAVVAGRGATVRRRCFVADGLRCIMPAFGAYAGGLNFLDATVMALFGAKRDAICAHVLGRDAVFTVSPRQCLPDMRTYDVWR